MQVVLFMDAMRSQVTFVVVMFSALIPGIFMGSTLSDYFGGFKGRALRNALSLCCFFGFMATLFSISLSFCFEPKVFIALLWAFFFFGAGIMPIASGIIVSCVPNDAQNSANAVYCICQNIIGLCLAPVLSGHIMESYENKRLGMIAGYRILLYAGVILTSLFGIARYMARRRFGKPGHRQS